MKSIFLAVIFISCFGFANPKVTIGADRLLSEYAHVVSGKRVAVVSNAVSLTSNNTHIIDVLLENNIQVTAVFSPEHGFSSAVSAGDKVGNSFYKNTKIPVYSLYGEIRKPKPEMLKGVDVIIYDLQDVGVRFYTYISTLMNIMQAAADAGIPCVVLDRPNPLGGELVEGPMLDTAFTSFVGIIKIPVVYGLTCGELALMAKGERLFAGLEHVQLVIVPLLNYNRKMRYADTQLSWTPPSPNIPDTETALVYPGTCFFEATNVSEGRGTDAPFLTIGAPFVLPDRLMNEIAKHTFPGLSFSPITFTPRSIEGKSTKPKLMDKKCSGVRITITDAEKIRPYETGIKLLCAFRDAFPDSMQFRKASVQRLSGTAFVYTKLAAGQTAEEIIASSRQEAAEFQKKSKKYYLYN